MFLFLMLLFSLAPLRKIYSLQKTTRHSFHTHLSAINQKRDNLNTAQVEAVSAPLNVASLCSAGPGSGKTKVLTHRIEYLINTLKQPPHSILAITFTNKAANEMKTRLRDLLGDTVANSLTVGTFHSISSRFLRVYGKGGHLKEIVGNNNIDERFSIYDTDDCLGVIKELLRAKGIADDIVKPHVILDSIQKVVEADVMAFSAAAANGAYAHVSTSKAGKIAKELLPEYRAKIHGVNALDFQDLLLQGYKLMRQVPSVHETILNRYRHVLVDEYQDTNCPNDEFIRLLIPPRLLTGTSSGEEGASTSRSLFAVGDVNQAIYGWRGAQPENMAGLQRDYGRVCTFGLKENYRCAKPITLVANAVLGQDATRAMERKESSKGKDEPVRVIATADDDAQARCISKIIQTLDASKESKQKEQEAPGRIPKKEKSIAVMYRTNAQSRAIESAFVEQGIKYRVLGGRRFYDRREVRDVLCFLRLLFNPHDSSAATRVMSGPAGKGIGEKTMASFFAWIADSHREAASTAVPVGSVLDHLYSLVDADSGAEEVEEVGSGVEVREEDAQGNTKSISKQMKIKEESNLLLRVEDEGKENVLSSKSYKKESENDAGVILSASTRLCARLIAPCPLTNREVKALASLGLAMKDLELLALADTVPSLIQAVLETHITEAYLSKISGQDAKETQDRRENVEELLKASSRYAHGAALPNGQLEAFLEEAVWIGDESAEGEGAESAADVDSYAGYASLMTIHASKGLEFDIVFLTGCEESFLPLVRGFGGSSKAGQEKESEEVAEERRLAFVAITRAKKLLFLLYRKKAMKFGMGGSGGSAGVSWQNMTPSRFLQPLNALSKDVIAKLNWSQ